MVDGLWLMADDWIFYQPLTISHLPFFSWFPGFLRGSGKFDKSGVAW
jgi:hypothetical protein